MMTGTATYLKVWTGCIRSGPEIALLPPPALCKGLKGHDDRDPNLSQGLDPALLVEKIFDRPITTVNIGRNSL